MRKIKKKFLFEGIAMKTARVLTKIIPHKLVVEIMKRF